MLVRVMQQVWPSVDCTLLTEGVSCVADLMSSYADEKCVNFKHVQQRVLAELFERFEKGLAEIRRGADSFKAKYGNYDKDLLWGRISKSPS